MIVITIIEKSNILSFNSIGTQCCIHKHYQGEAKQVLAEIKGDEAPIHVCGYMAHYRMWGLLQEKFNFRLSEITSGAFSDKYLTTKVIY